LKVCLSTLLALACASAVAVALACSGSPSPPPPASCELSPTQTFEERIAPLLTDGRKSTCNQCHLSGVDLSAFARATPCQTWACLVDQGLVDVTAPQESKILAWIERASPDSDLITPEVIEAERDAFEDWIDANVACPAACAGSSEQADSVTPATPTMMAAAMRPAPIRIMLRP